MINDGQEYFNLSEDTFSYKRSFSSKRKQWDKSNPLPEINFTDSNSNLIGNKRCQDHLKKLQQNNQYFENIKIAKKNDSKTEKLKKLEAGFCVYINGAHRKKERYALRHTIAKSVDKNKNQKCQEHFKPQVRTSRKKWAESSFTIKTSDGFMIKINAPNNENTYKTENTTNLESNEDNNFLNNLEKNDFDKYKLSESSETDTDVKEDSSREIMVQLTPKDAKDFGISEDEKSTKYDLEKHKNVLETDNCAEICDIILSKIVNLRQEDRITLKNFLFQIEENAKKSIPE